MAQMAKSRFRVCLTRNLVKTPDYHANNFRVPQLCHIYKRFSVETKPQHPWAQQYNNSSSPGEQDATPPPAAPTTTTPSTDTVTPPIRTVTPPTGTVTQPTGTVTQPSGLNKTASPFSSNVPFRPPYKSQSFESRAPSIAAASTETNRKANRSFAIESIDEITEQSIDDQGRKDYLNSQRLDHRLWAMDSDIRRFGRVDPRVLDDYISLLDPSTKISPSVALTLLKSSGIYLLIYPNEKRVERTHKIWDLLSERGVQFDISHFNCLLSIYLENEHKFSPIEFLAKLEKYQVDANRVTLQRLIKRYAMMGDLLGVGTILEHMKSLDMPLTEHVCNSLLYANIKAKNDKELRSVIDFMKSNDIELTLDSYIEMTSAYAEIGDYGNVTKILSEQVEIEFPDSHILNLLYIFAKNNNVEHTKALLNRTRKLQGYVHTALNWALRLNSLGKCHEALDVLSTVTMGQTVSGQAVEYGGSLLIQAIDLNFGYDKIVDLCKTMKLRGINNRALEGCYVIAIERRQTKLASKLLNSLVKQNDLDSPIRAQCYWPLVLLACKDKDYRELQKVVNDMQSNGFRLNERPLASFVWPCYISQKKPGIELLEIVKNHFPNIPEADLATSLLITYFQQRLRTEILDFLKAYTHQINFHALVEETISDYGLRTNDWSTLVEFFKHKSMILDTERLANFIFRAPFNIRNENTVFLVKLFAEHKIPCHPNIFELSKRSLTLQMPDIQECLSTMVEFHREREARMEEWKQKITGQSLNPSTMTDEELEHVALTDKTAMQGLITFAISKSSFSDIVRLYRCMESVGKMIPVGLLVRLMHLACQKNEFDWAITFFKNIYKNKRSNEFLVANIRLLNLIVPLLDQGRFDSVLDVMKIANANFHQNDDEKPETRKSDTNQTLRHQAEPLIENLLTNVFQKLFSKNQTENNKQSELLNDDQRLEIFQEICKYKPFDITHYHVTPFIDQLMADKKLDFAKQVFESMFKFTGRLAKPYKLMQELASKNDVTGLQKIYDISAPIMGEGRAALKLAVALATVGRLKDASKILSAPNIRIIKELVLNEAKLLFESNDDIGLLGLLNISKSKFQGIRNDLFVFLLNSYKRKRNGKGALDVWTLMQEEDFTPPKETLMLLSSILKENGLPDPFSGSPKIPSLSGIKKPTMASALLNKLKASNS